MFIKAAIDKILGTGKKMRDQQNTNSDKSHPLQRIKRLKVNRPITWLALLVVLIVVLAAWIVEKKQTLQEQAFSEGKIEQSPTNVVTLELSPKAISEQMSLPAMTHPWVDLQIVSEVQGKVAKKLVKKGQSVKKGSVLAQIDDREYRIALSSARASFHAAKAAHDRLKKLHQEEVASRGELDNAIAQLSTARAVMQSAALNLARCQILAPIEGVVDDLTVEVGQYLKNGDSVARILQIDRIKVIAGIPESDVNAIRSAKEFLITIDALNKKTFRGTYNYLSRSTNSLAHAYQLEIAVSNLESEILPGMFARAEIVKKQISNALSVPLFALLPYKNSHAVLIASHGRAKQVPVTTGIQEGWEVQVVNGLSPGDQVIVVGQRDIGDCAPVKVLRTVSNVEELR